MVCLAVPAAVATLYDSRRGTTSSAAVVTDRGMDTRRSDLDALVAKSVTSRYSDWIEEALEELHDDSFLITDPCISGHPIVFASRGFLRMSGYAREEVVGRNGRIFQGPGTDRRSVIEIREAIREEREMQISLLNYRKDGSPNWILFHLCPVFAKEDGQVIHFVAVQVPIARQRRASTGGSRVGRGCSGGRGVFFGSCRGEVCADAEIRCNLAVESFVDSDNRVLEAEQFCEASDVEKQKAINAANNILSALTHYSELTGKMVSRQRRNLVSIAPLSSSLYISLGRIKQSFVLTDPHLPDMPIVYASEAFLSLTGYSRHEVVGRNCSFLNGPDTDIETLHLISESIQAAHGCSVRILNYRKDGSSFWNLLHISPVRNSSGKIAFYVSVQIDECEKNTMQGLSPEMKQLGAVGAVKVAVRSLSSGVGSSKSRTIA